jgi:catechol 2,3-dioxygenase-like lactoylglutathione lyase family enzyme
VIARVDHLVLNVADVEATAAWYVKVLGMRRELDGRGRTILWFGEQKLHVRPVDASQDEWFTGRCPTAGSDDLCFEADATIDEVVAHLAACGVAIEHGPGEKPGARGPMTSVYCRDPDGSLIEVASYSNRR